MPHVIKDEPPHLTRLETSNTCKPLIAQGLLLSLKRQGKRIQDQSWAEDAYQRLTRYLGYIDTHHTDRHGFFTPRSHRGGGTDNIPTVYGRPPNSTAPKTTPVAKPATNPRRHHTLLITSSIAAIP